MTTKLSALSYPTSSLRKFESAKRPDLVCYDNSKLTAGGQADKLLVVEFKKPGVSIGTSELAQVMAYKSIFKASLAKYEEEDIEVIILGDTVDSRFDRTGLGAGYLVLSYLELLEGAKARYRDFYEMLVPEGAPVPGVAEATSPAESTVHDDGEDDWEDADPEPLETEGT